MQKITQYLVITIACAACLTACSSRDNDFINSEAVIVGKRQSSVDVGQKTALYYIAFTDKQRGYSSCTIGFVLPKDFAEVGQVMAVSNNAIIARDK